MTADGEYILLHDDNFIRMCGVDKKPEDMTLEEIESLTVTGGNGISKYSGNYDATHICTLTEYLEICREYNMVPVIEIKISLGSNPKFNDTVFQNEDDLDQSFDATICDIDKTVRFVMGDSKYIYIAFDSNVIKEFSNIRSERGESNMELQFIFRVNDSTIKENIKFCKECGAALDIKNFTKISSYTMKSLINKAHSQGLEVNVWTINSSTRASQLNSYGVDYITTETAH